MKLDGLDADVQLGGDLPVGLPGGGGLRHGQLTGGQRRLGWPGLAWPWPCAGAGLAPSSWSQRTRKGWAPSRGEQHAGRADVAGGGAALARPAQQAAPLQPGHGLFKGMPSPSRWARLVSKAASASSAGAGRRAGCRGRGWPRPSRRGGRRRRRAARTGPASARPWRLDRCGLARRRRPARRSAWRVPSGAAGSDRRTVSAPAASTAAGSSRATAIAVWLRPGRRSRRLAAGLRGGPACRAAVSQWPRPAAAYTAARCARPSSQPWSRSSIRRDQPLAARRRPGPSRPAR